MRKGNLFVISGPSGAGKGTIVEKAMRRVADAWLSISATTRKPRVGEVDGTHYFFVTNEEFDEMIRQGNLLEWADVHGKKYGTPKQSVEEQILQGKQVILEIDVQGALQVKEILPQAHLVFIEPPSMEELHRRLLQRNTDSKEVIELRMKNALEEVEMKQAYDVSFVNDDLNTCVDSIVAYIDAQADM